MNEPAPCKREPICQFPVGIPLHFSYSLPDQIPRNHNLIQEEQEPRTVQKSVERQLAGEPGIMPPNKRKKGAIVINPAPSTSRFTMWEVMTKNQLKDLHSTLGEDVQALGEDVQALREGFQALREGFQALEKGCRALEEEHMMLSEQYMALRQDYIALGEKQKKEYELLVGYIAILNAHVSHLEANGSVNGRGDWPLSDNTFDAVIPDSSVDSSVGRQVFYSYH
ncbi:hypothetical protein EDB81DRAFT_859479 [Dactylonectria macrodidyma]|uniref:Uncharacterized protein n=1 Tax=Dactylonectria macrodidyma TaxID=307937 RepID=A0A9P9IRS7_9HYPO|nr:hypothetical protein EDB81DRAFT_859479 [Dactylonectria macrodidyma]